MFIILPPYTLPPELHIIYELALTFMMLFNNDSFFLRGSRFGLHTIIDIQNSLQTQICAEKMQLWVWCSALLTHITLLIILSIKCLCSVFPVSSAFGWHLECHRGFPRERHQHHGPHRWALCGSSRSGAEHHFLPAEQAHAHHPPDPRGSVHQPAAQLPAGILWPVSSTSCDVSAAGSALTHLRFWCEPM